MKNSTVVPQKYFNGVVKPEERDRYLKLLLENFKEVGMVAFGQIKFLLKELPKSQNDYDFRTIDNLVVFARKHNLKLHYNTVINNKNSFPDWYLLLKTSQKIEFLKFHVKTIIDRYKNDFYLFKLVNESVRDVDEDFLGTGEKKIDLIAQIFKWAKEESPNTLFMINDFGCFYRKDILTRFIKLVNDVKDKGAQIDVVGEQAHFWGFELPSDEIILNTTNTLNTGTGLPVNITEFDLSYDDTLYEGQKIDPLNEFTDRNGKTFKNWFEYQGYAYKHFYDLCNNSGLVNNFTYWGFVDEEVPWERPGIGIFDYDFNNKNALKSLIKEFLIKK